MFLNKKSKFSIGFLSIIILFVFILGNFSYPQKARAQFTVVDPWVWYELFTVRVESNIKETVKTIKENLIAATFKRVLQGFFNKLAYDFATDLAEMGPGKSSLFEGRSMGDLVRSAGDAAVSTFINDIAKGTIGVDLCKPKNPKLKLTLQFSLYDTHLDPDFNKPDCSLQEMGEKWGKLYDELTNDWGKLVSLNEQDLAGIGFEGDSANQARIKLAKSMLDPKQSDVNFVSQIIADAKEEKAKKEQEARDEKEKIDEARGLLAPKDTITGTDTGSTVTTEEKLKGIGKTWEAVKEFTGDPFADVANIFLNTFTQKLMDRIIREMFKQTPGPTEYEMVTVGGPIIPISGEFLSAKDYIDQIFSQINKLSYNTSPTNIDVISEMEMDLRGDDIVGLMNNGTIDGNFSQALREAQLGEPLTVEEAMIRNGWENKWFGFVGLGSQNVQQPNLQDGFSYDNMKVLRKNRVIPVGWEMAALKIKSPTFNISESECGSYGCTLETVLSHYDQTGTYALIDNAEISEFQNDYCGWRPIGLEPYNIDINDSNNCNKVIIGQVRIDGVEVKWEGSDMGTPNNPLDDNIPGYCNKYTTSTDSSFIGDIEIEAGMNQTDCESRQPDAGSFYEWEPGGCMIKEADEGELCGLVNPDWVLKAPPQECGAKGYYSALSSTDSADRYQECADVKHCIDEDENGNCLGAYDYCTKEENIWKFKGNSCSDYYSSCLTLKDDQGQVESYLTDTLKTCNETQVGCRDYLTEKELDDGFYEWKEGGDKIYLNNNAEECDIDLQGCSEFIEIKPGVNLITNSSFEIDEEEDDTSDGWKLHNAGSDFSLTTNHQQFGINSLRYFNAAESSYFYQYLNIPSRGLYTLSYYVKGNGSVIPKLKIGDEAPYVVVENEDTKFDSDGDDISEWQRKTGYFSILDAEGNAHDDSEVRKHILFGVEGEIYIDGIQFELNSLEYSDVHEGEGSPSSYKRYGENGESYIKKAPDYYNCDTNFIDECNDFAKYCSAVDIGCESYAPVNGDPFVPAVLKSNDLCVQECNNYQTFVENSSYFDILEDATILPIDKNFIADTAKDCPASEASCELFTNIDALERGAEAKEYYSFVRQCVKPDEATTKLFYTWEGSDTSAFQLKTWKLLASTSMDPFPLDDPVGGYAPCTNVQVGGIACLDNADNVEECDPTDLNGTFDCRTFYDEGAIPHNRLLSKTIPITEECINLRRENSNQIYKVAPSMSRACSASNVGCLAYEGNNSNNIRNVFIEEFELGTISGWMAEDGSGNQINTQHSNESIYYNGHSMKVWSNTGQEDIYLYYNLTENLNISAEDILNKKYSLSFWAKSFGNNDGETSVSSLYDGVNDNFIDFDQDLSVASPGWLFYKYDPVAIHTTTSRKDVILRFKVKINNVVGQANDGFYIDNIILKEISSDFYKIKDSWNTPRICSDNSYLGCQQYKDRYGDNWYIYQFSDLCAEEDIGCTAMIDTQNSSMPFQQTFNAFCNDVSDNCDVGRYYYKNDGDVPGENNATSTIIIPEDELVYIVKDDNYSCLPDKKGCQVLGAINNEETYDSFYKLNDPDKYISDDYYGGTENTLCLDEDKNCSVFSIVNGSGVKYKIHPRNLTCTYQDDPQGNIEAGFYTDDGRDCTGLLYNINYDNLTSSIAEDWKPFHDYTGGYAALCKDDQSKCSSFIDPLDNQNMLDYLYSQVGIQNLNFKDIAQWRQARWNKDAELPIDDLVYFGNFDNFTHEGISINVNNEEIRVNLQDGMNTLIYKGPESGQNTFDFYAESGSIYRLSANIKLDATQSVNVLLSCKQSNITNQGYLYSNDTNKIPYAFPAITANYYTNENIDDWQNIYGLYKILPGANYCNVAFYIHGETGDNVIIKDINFSKVSGKYNYLDDDNLDRESCTAPNLEDGCVLFHNTADSNLQYNSTQAYNLGGQGANDSNILLKVIRDRECSEWVTCGATLETFDKASGQLQDSCISLIGCDELSEAGSGLCSHPFNTGSQAQPLTFDYYLRMRGKGAWFDDDYSGYSIPGLYSLDALVPVEMEEDVYDLGHLIVKKDGDTPYVYKTGIGLKPDSVLGDYRVYSNWVETIDKACRLYPEQNSPFPWTSNNNIVLQIDRDDDGDPVGGDEYVIFTEKDSSFKNANICQPNFIDWGFFGGDYSIIPTDMDCECHYTIADYGAEKLFYPYDYDIDNIPTSTAPSYGYSTDAPVPMKLKSTSKNLGWKGFCLEDDNSLLINNTNVINAEHRCLSWYPVDIISGEMDAYAVNPEATVNNLVADNAKLCAISEDYQVEYDRMYCDEVENGICKSFLIVGKGSVLSADFNKEINDSGMTCLDTIKSDSFLDKDPYGRTAGLGINFELGRVKFTRPNTYSISNLLGKGLNEVDKIIYQMNLDSLVIVSSDDNAHLKNIFDISELKQCYNGSVMRLTSRPRSFMTIDGYAFKVFNIKKRCLDHCEYSGDAEDVSTLYYVDENGNQIGTIQKHDFQRSDRGCGDDSSLECNLGAGYRYGWNYYVPAMHPGESGFDWKDESSFGQGIDSVFISAPDETTGCCEKVDDINYRCLTQEQIDIVMADCLKISTIFSDSLSCNKSTCTIGEVRDNCNFMKGYWGRFGCGLLANCRVHIPGPFLSFDYTNCYKCESQNPYCHHNNRQLITDFFDNYGNRVALLYESNYGLLDRYWNINDQGDYSHNSSNLPDELEDLGLNIDNFYPFLNYWKNNNSLTLNDLWSDGTAEFCEDDWSNAFSDDTFIANVGCGDTEPNAYDSNGRKDPERDLSCWTPNLPADNSEKAINDGWLECALIRKLRFYKEKLSNFLLPSSICDLIGDINIFELYYYDNNGNGDTIDLYTNVSFKDEDQQGKIGFCESIGWMNALFGLNSDNYICPDVYPDILAGENNYVKWLMDNGQASYSLPSTVHTWCDTYSPSSGFVDGCNFDEGCIQTCQTYMDISNATFDSNNFYLNWMATEKLTSENPCDLYGTTSLDDDICPGVINSSIGYYGQPTQIRFDQILQTDGWKNIAPSFSAVGSEGELRSMALRYDDNPFSYDYYAPKDSDLSVTKGRLNKLLIKIPNENFQEYQDGWGAPSWSGTYWNMISEGVVTPEAPIVNRVEHDVQTGFSEGLAGISINNKAGQHIVGVDGDLYAYLSFYAYAEQGQAPLTKIEIDWTGLGNNKLILEGPFENHKHDCVRRCGTTYKDAFIDEPLGDKCIDYNDCGEGFDCFAETWGDYVDACVEDNSQTGEKGYFSYSYIYTCDPLNDYWQGDCSDYDLDGGCCVYKPEVIVYDNWGQETKATLGNCEGIDCAVIVLPR